MAYKIVGKPVVILMGPQGSGKGTQSKTLCESFDFGYAETGELLRSAAKKHGHIAKVVRQTISQGRLVPLSYAVDVLQKALEKQKNKPILIDGSPRQVTEAYALERILKKIGRSIDLVLYIELSPEESMKRLLKRKRPDDTPESIRKRLAWTRAKTGKVLEYFYNKYPVEKIEGKQTVKQVHKDIMQALRKHNIITNL